jgi:hypothetical protein
LRADDVFVRLLEYKAVKRGRRGQEEEELARRQREETRLRK